MGRSSVRPVVRGFIAEQHVRSMFTGTSQICTRLRRCTHLIRNARSAQGVQADYQWHTFYPVFRTHTVQRLDTGYPQSRLPE